MVAIIPLEDEDLKEKYEDIEEYKGKKGKITRIILSRTGSASSDLIEPTTRNIEYKIEFEDGNSIIVPHEAIILVDPKRLSA